MVASARAGSAPVTSVGCSRVRPAMNRARLAIATCASVARPLGLPAGNCVTGQTRGSQTRHARCTSRGTMRAPKLGQVVVLGSLLIACAETGDEGGAADIQGEDEKAD